MKHSNQVREFVLSSSGFDMLEVYAGADGVLTGTARVAQEAQERAAEALRQEDHQRRLRQLASRQKAIEAQIAALRAEADTEAMELNFALAHEAVQKKDKQRISEVFALQRGGKRGNRQPKEKR